MKLTGKIFIEGKLQVVTGLHIGGNKSSLEIGGVDLNVIKTGRGVPYIPGSSLKGKLRSLLAKVEGSDDARVDSDALKILFGDAGGKENGKMTRLQVRDAMLDEEAFNAYFGDKQKRIMDFEFSEVKTENTIERTNGTAKNPRLIERVPAGSVFNLKFVLDLYEGDNAEGFLKKIESAFELLEMDYLGGHGTRGAGQVRIGSIVTKGRTISESGISEMPAGNWSNFFQEFRSTTGALQ